MFDTLHDLLSSEYSNIFWLMFVFPSEAIMPAVGFAAHNDSLSLPVALLFAVAGSMLSATLMYWVFRLVRESATRSFIRKYGRYVGLSQKGINRAERWFNRHAKTTVVF